MGDRMLNGRRPLDWELPAMERGYAYLLERDCEQVAGLLASVDAEHAPRPVTDIVWEFS